MNDTISKLHGNTRVYVYNCEEGYVIPMRTTLARARAKNYCVVECSYCDNPAVKLDHLFPYHHEYNKCKHHLSND